MSHARTQPCWEPARWPRHFSRSRATGSLALACAVGAFIGLLSGCGSWGTDPDWRKSRLPLVGLPEPLVELPFGYASELVWATDGRTVFALFGPSSHGGAEVQRIDLSSRQARSSGLPAAEIVQGSPDGRFLALVGDSGSVARPLYVAQFPDYRAVLLDSTQRYQQPVWSGDSRTLAYVANYREESIGTFTWSYVVVNATTRQTIKVIDDNGSLLALSPDGGRLLATSCRGGGSGDRVCELVIHDLLGDSAIHLGAPPDGEPLAVRWGQAGITFVTRGVGPELRVTSVSDAAASFTVAGGPCTSRAFAAFSPDGRKAAFWCYERIAPPGAEDWVDFGTYSHLFVLDLETRETRLLANGGSSGPAAFSPDGSALAFYLLSRTETGALYVLDVP